MTDFPGRVTSRWGLPRWGKICCGYPLAMQGCLTNEIAFPHCLLCVLHQTSRSNARIAITRQNVLAMSVIFGWLARWARGRNAIDPSARKQDARTTIGQNNLVQLTLRETRDQWGSPFFNYSDIDQHGMLVAASQVGTLLARPRQGSDSRGGKDKLWLQDRASTQPQSQAPAIATFLSDVCAMTEIELHKN